MRVGLCESCLWCRRVATRRGSVFHLCARSETDSRFPKYPRLPVLDCPGYEQNAGGKGTVPLSDDPER